MHDAIVRAVFICFEGECADAGECGQVAYDCCVGSGAGIGGVGCAGGITGVEDDLVGGGEEAGG